MKPITRRNFIKNAGGAGIALWLGISAKGTTAKVVNSAAVGNFTPYILVESNGNITLFNTKPKMGQGTFQSIPALIAEELEVSLDQVIIRQSNGEKELGNAQRAGGSASVRTSYNDLRKVGAAAKEMFIKAASMKWQVDAEGCYAENGTVIHRPTRQVLTYGELAEDASKLEIPKEPKLKDPKDFKILGKSIKRPDVPLKTCGKAMFGLDVQLPGMLCATVERVMALSAAIKPGITIENGKVVQHNFYDNPLVRINEVPAIEVHILAEGGKIKGVGEPGVPPFAPALANAIFAATGKRIRKMPFDLQVG